MGQQCQISILALLAPTAIAQAWLPQRSAPLALLAATVSRAQLSPQEVARLDTTAQQALWSTQHSNVLLVLLATLKA
jgi:hypothetical protein